MVPIPAAVGCLEFKNETLPGPKAPKHFLKTKGGHRESQNLRGKKDFQLILIKYFWCWMVMLQKVVQA